MSRIRPRTWQALVIACALLIAMIIPLASSTSFAAAVPAALPNAVGNIPLPASTQFDLVGFLDTATLDASCTNDPHCGGILTVNSHTVIVPAETIVLLPANALTWQELFAQAPVPYTGVATGMALADKPAPSTTFEVHAVGNRVNDKYIAGLIWISQQSLNAGAGYINSMDYATGEMRVGGVIGDPNSGARVQINDPNGRFGRQMSPDPRFTVDADNPTISAETGFPMCFPRTDPAISDDPLCPQGNRPVDPATPAVHVTKIQMRHPIVEPGAFPDANKQAPFEIGDYISFAGTRFVDANGPYISAHTISANLAIFTWPGTDPAYIKIDDALLGTGGQTIAGAAEAAARSRVEGMTTDPSRGVSIYAVDFNPSTGEPSDRFLGAAGVDQGPPLGAVMGRFRFRPRQSFIPATREVRAVIDFAWNPGQTTNYANGIIAGQYHAPASEYLFPEAIPGNPVVANNFGTLDFLAKGGYTSSTGVVAKVLRPWPDAVEPAPSCIAPIADTGGPYTVGTSSSVALVGSAIGSAPMTYQWSAGVGSFSDATLANPSYTATAIRETVPLTLIVTNACGTSTANSTIVVGNPTPPIVNPIPAQTVLAGQGGVTLIATSSPDVIFTWQQTSGPNVLRTNPTTGAMLIFNAPNMPNSQVTPIVLTFQVTARSLTGVTSAPVTATVTVNPIPDVVAITTSNYIISRSKLTITAVSSVTSPNVILTLQPYLANDGTMFDPTGLGNVFTNNGNGTYTLTLIGAPTPALPPETPFVVTSNHGGVSVPTALQTLRL